MNDAITACDAAIESGDAASVADTVLKINPDFRDPQYTKIGMVNGDSTKQVRTFEMHQTRKLLSLFVFRTVSKKIRSLETAYLLITHPIFRTIRLETVSAFFGSLFRVFNCYFSDPFKNNADAFSSSDPFNAAFPSKADVSVGLD